MRMNHRKMQERGFTLIEIIVTLVIAAILASLYFTYSTSKSFTGSVTPVQSVQYASNIHQIMERITADYEGYPRWKPNTPYTTASRVVPLKRNGYFYQPTAACTSGAAEPSTWSTTNGSTSAEGGSGCTWRVTYSATTPTNPILSLATLRQKIAGNVANSSGEGNTVYYNGNSATGMQYRIVNNRYIDPASSWDTASGSATAYLKVTIQSASGGERLTAIFTE